MPSNKEIPARNNVIDFILDRELSWRRNISPEFRYMLHEDLRDIVSSTVPQTLHKEVVRYPYEDKCNKIFAAQWIGPDSVCFGTKDNQLQVWRYTTGEVTNITFPDTDYTKTFSSPEVIGDPATSPNFMAEPNEVQEVLPTTGIHDIDINASRTFLVSGGRNDHDMALFDLPFMKPSAILRGHSDCVFASKFIADDVILSGGRDGALMLWNVSSSSKGEVTAPDDTVRIITPTRCVMRSPFRVRSIERCDFTDRVFVLCGDGTLALFDCHTMHEIHYTPLPEETDLVCLAVSEENSAVAVGCQSGTLVLDTRNGCKITELCDVGLPYGVRSLTFNRDVLTIGGGDGSIDFFDVRMLSRRLKHPLICSQGSVRTTPYYPDTEPIDAPQAVYTLKYDPDCGNKLFVAGGPLVCGLNGSYASIWA